LSPRLEAFPRDSAAPRTARRRSRASARERSQGMTISAPLALHRDDLGPPALAGQKRGPVRHRLGAPLRSSCADRPTSPNCRPHVLGVQNLRLVPGRRASQTAGIDPKQTKRAISLNVRFSQLADIPDRYANSIKTRSRSFRLLVFRPFGGPKLKLPPHSRVVGWRSKRSSSRRTWFRLKASATSVVSQHRLSRCAQ
jgi:hypothetical protein